MDKDFEHMPLEERKFDPEWLKMTTLERLHAAGLCTALDGEKITLDEYRNGMPEEREAKIEKIREKWKQELEEKRSKAYKWLEEHGNK